MKNAILYSFCIVLLAALAACSGSGDSFTPQPDTADLPQFTVTADGADAAFTPELVIEKGASETRVRIDVTDADAIDHAYVQLAFDNSAYSPVAIEYGSFLGQPDDLLAIGLTSVEGLVPLGMHQIANRSVSPVSGSGHLATVTFRHEEQVVKNTAGVPNGEVTDLRNIGQEGTTVTLQWTEKNKGDYNNDGVVSLADVTPVAQNFNQNLASAPDPIALEIVDGDGNGVVSLSDITPIAQNFGNELTGYVVFTDAEGTEMYGSGITVYRSDMVANTTLNPNPKHPVVYRTEVDTGGAGSGVFRVAPADDNMLPQHGPLSNEATGVIVEDGPPVAPTGLELMSGSTIGHKQVFLMWDASTSPDVQFNVIQRKLTSEETGAFADVYQLGGDKTSHVDADPALTEESYDYRVYTIDYDGNKSYERDLPADWFSNTESIVPYFAPAPSPPLNLVADGRPTSVFLSWDAPADDTGITRYRIYREAPGETGFTPIGYTPNKSTRTYNDTGLTAGETYSYFVTSVGGDDVESDPSNTDSAVPEEFVEEINITDFTTDKTTHTSQVNDYPEPDSNLSVTCDQTPDSVEWDAGGAGVLTPNGTTATWAATDGMDTGLVTVTVTVHLGTVQDSATLNLYVTVQPRGPMFEEFSPDHHDPYPLLEPLNMGGNVVNDRPFAYYADEGHVTWLKLTGLWCSHCLLELPDFDEMITDYGDSGFNFVIDADDSAADMKTYFQNNDYQQFHSYCRSGDPFGEYWEDFYGYQGGYPAHAVFDRDGHLRITHTGGIYNNVDAFREVVEQMLGI